jgi:hypothetical protein
LIQINGQAFSLRGFAQVCPRMLKVVVLDSEAGVYEEFKRLIREEAH